MRGFAVTAADNAIVAAAAIYRPENPKKLQDQWLKDELGRRPPTVASAPRSERLHRVADRDGYGEPSSKIGCELATRIHPFRVAGGRGFSSFIAAAFFRQRCAVRNNDLQNALAQLVVLLRERMGKYRRRCVG
jgi:hypothetical protein